MPAELLDTLRTFNPYTYENQVDDYTQQHYQLHYFQRLLSATTFNLSLHYTRGKGFYEQFRPEDDLATYGLFDLTLLQVQNGDTLPVTTADLVRRKWLDNHFYGTVLNLQHRWNDWDWTLGGGWNQYDGRHFGEVIWSESMPSALTLPNYYDGNGLKTEANIYLKTFWHLKQSIHFLLDLQHRWVDYRISGTDDEKGEVDF